MTTKEKVQLASFNFFCKEMNRLLVFDLNDEDKQDQIHLAYISFKRQKMFTSASEWIQFFFIGFTLIDNKMQLK